MLFFFLLGIVFATLNAFIRPILVLITGQLLISSMGLFLVVINFIVLVLLYAIFPTRLIVDPPQIIWLLIASVLISVIVFALEAILGLNQPDVDAQGKGRGVWQLAAASTAQVHRAVLHDGRNIVVKVQRPNIVKQTAADLGVIQKLVNTICCPCSPTPARAFCATRSRRSVCRSWPAKKQRLSAGSSSAVCPRSSKARIGGLRIWPAAACR